MMNNPISDSCFELGVHFQLHCSMWTSLIRDQNIWIKV